MKHPVVRQWGGPVLVLITLLMLTACTSRESAAWEETFDAPGDWRLSADAAAEITVQDGVLRIHVAEIGQVAWASAGRTYGNCRLTVEATQLAGPSDNEYGVLLRLQDDRHFYAFSVSGDGYVRAARYDGVSWTVLGADWTPNAAVRQGEATNILEVEATGATFVFRVNGEQVLQVADTTYPKGDIALYAGTFSEGDLTITFDNLKVESLP